VVDIQVSNASLRDAVSAEAPSAFAFLSALVTLPSLRGEERGAQELVESKLTELGFDVERLAIPESIGDDELGGVPASSYEGRFDVLGRMPHDGGRSLLLNGHIDVVPANVETWSSDPFDAVVRDGWLYGRGAGDMKGGFAMAVLALQALRRLGATAGRQNVSFLSVIEEEYTGNGTLAAVRAGVSADAVLLPEPTDLKILLGGVAITWVKIAIYFGGGHAESSDRLASPAQVVSTLIEDFGRLEERYNTNPQSPYDSIARPYNVNVGVIRLGEWPSSVPAVAEVEVRVGHSADVNDAEILAEVRSLVGNVLKSAGDPEFDVSLHGFKAQAYYLPEDHPLVQGVATAHAEVHGAAPAMEVLGSTTDARYYVNQLGVPALCFGPVVKNMHGSDECVELASIEDGAATLARFILNYFDEGVEGGGA
jgi:acetylornithine deacetylase